MELAKILELFDDDPWALTVEQRQLLSEAKAEEQGAALRRLRRLVEPPLPNEDFPAFLLATARFAGLRAQIGEARLRRDLDVGTADELQRFVDCYWSWLRTTDPIGDSFAHARPTAPARSL